MATDLTQSERIIRELAKRTKVIAFDNRGVGRTDKPDLPYSIDLMADDTAGLLAALGIERAHVLGISMGGRVAVALALRYPARVRSLILVSTSVKRIPINWWRRLIFLIPRIPVLGTLGDRYPQPYYAFARQRDASRAYDAADRIHEVRVPTLILHGKSDRVAPYRLAEEMHAGIRGSKLIAFDGGHLFPFFQQPRFLKAVLDFVESLAAGSSNGG
ncbi:MAG: alpha/beta fold hydrolase [Chloroflexota bacterium]